MIRLRRVIRCTRATNSLYDQGLTNLFDDLVVSDPASAYSYFQGKAQTLDQILLSSGQDAELAQVAVAHINSDWAADSPGGWRARHDDHDPTVTDFPLLPTLDRLEALTQFFADAGMIQGDNTLRILLDRLARAREDLAAGRQAAYLAQLQAFAIQVSGFTPRFITEEAGSALATEARLLDDLGWIRRVVSKPLVRSQLPPIGSAVGHAGRGCAPATC